MTPRRLGDDERLDWLQLSRSEGIGPRTFLSLLQRFGSAAAALDAFPALARKRAGLTLCPRDTARRELVALDKRRAHLIALGEPDYPPALRAIDSAPPLLAANGNLAALHRPMVAFVGSRNASAPGLLMTERLVAAVAQAGYVVVSGLARGIDARAHRTAAGPGSVAVLAGGLDRIYPPENAGLAASLCAEGAVLTEMPLGWEPRARDFPRRNRIVSGLALATVVVEAARRSGSLITARFAGEQGRDVFAVPGSPLEPRCEGSNDLLRQGATLCTCGDDLLEALAAVSTLREAPGPGRRAEGPGATQADDIAASEADLDDLPELDDEGTILNLLGTGPVALDDLVRLTGLDVGRLRSAVIGLEVDGRVQVEGGRVSRSYADN